jgi:hypothetical protein
VGVARSGGDNGLENRTKWYSRKYIDVLGVLLIVTGSWTAIIFFPAIYISILLFAIIAGTGVLICYRLVCARLASSSDLFLGFSILFGIAAWGYACYTTLMGYTAYRYYFIIIYGIRSQNSYSLLIDSLKIVVPIVFGGTLVLARLLRKKLSYSHKTWDAFKKVAPFTLLVLTPFTIGFLHDYNRRCDTSRPQVMQLRVVSHWTEEWIGDYGENEDEHWLRAETLDGKRSYSFRINFNSGPDEGALLEIKVHSGALGYEWLEVDL